MSALLALSDVAVVRALERCYSRALSGDARRHIAEAGIPRHHAYQKAAIPTPRHTHALADAWALLPELGWRWQLVVDPAEWAIVLDHYTRSLLSSQAEHNLDDLEAALRTLGAGHAT